VSTLGGLYPWKYYFFDLPLLSSGIKLPGLESCLRKFLARDLTEVKDGYVSLCRYLDRQPTAAEAEEVATKSLWVKLIRESDAYTCLKMTPKNIERYFHFKGLENLKAAEGQGRPVILLTGHIGSFFIPAIAFAATGFTVYPVARSVDRSGETPYPTRLYLELNYKLSSRRFPGKYLYSDFSGKIDRSIATVARKNGILWTAIDMPRRLYPYKRCPVTLFGRMSSLPSGMIQWGIKKNAIFLTAWSTVDFSEEGGFYRLLTVDSSIPQETGVESVLREYANRLTQCIAEKPWQWMGLPIIEQYDESGGNKND
jgi:lauroyl/myristoyl acyltransferase